MRAYYVYSAENKDVYFICEAKSKENDRIFELMGQKRKKKQTFAFKIDPVIVLLNILPSRLINM